MAEDATALAEDGSLTGRRGSRRMLGKQPAAAILLCAVLSAAAAAATASNLTVQLPSALWLQSLT
ncbi:MAG: hypothetical protein E5W78_27865, partial [Mesorhizobium sp.]